VRLVDASFGYDAREVLSRVEVDLQRGDKMAIVGANGAGKTTLLRLLAGQLAPRRGTWEAGPLTRTAYFAQHAAETLAPGATVLGAIEDAAPPPWRPHIRSLLGNFLFTGDDVFKLCRVLSGGERQRVALARLLMEPANLLLLDEPTHHLDLAGKEVLEDALAQFPGAVVVVTHDRSLMARLATRVLEVDAGRVRLYPGGYDDYEAARLAKLASVSAAPAPDPRAAGRPASAGAGRPAGAGAGSGARSRPAPRTGGGAADAAPAAGGGRGRERQEQKRQRSEQRKKEREAGRIAKDIETREARMKALETELADPALYHDAARSKDRVTEYERLRAEVESLWQRLGELG
jgi:ATP-binding cassette subfamily F protein 3